MNGYKPTKRESPGGDSRGFPCLQLVVPKVRVELTGGDPHRFLSLVRIVLISAVRRDLVQPPEYFPESVRA